MKRIDEIIAESFNKLLVEEFGIIRDLEPLADFILQIFFNSMLRDCLDNKKYAINVYEKLDMQYIKKNVNCNNWYGIDNIEALYLRTSNKTNGEEASINFDESQDIIVPIVIINLYEDFRKINLYTMLRKYGKQEVFNKFNGTYKKSIMHELTHLIEVVRTWENHKYPAYTYMSDPSYEDQYTLNLVRHASFAFSKTEMNARVTTLYYQILNDDFLINKIKSWNNQRRELCKFIINYTSSYNFVNAMRKMLFIVRRAAEKGEKPDIDFVRSFLKINKLAAFSGSKNLFKIKWKPTDTEETAFNWSNEQLIKMAWKLYDDMESMYYNYIKKLYKAADFAIDTIKNGQTAAL